MGSAGGDFPPDVILRARAIGEQIAEHDCFIVTGACPGLPQQAVLGYKSRGGFAVGISPALCLDEHIQGYHSPWEEYDVLIFTGSGLMGREIEAIRSCDIVIILGGRSGTLGEFSIAYDEGKLIGVLLGTDGIAEHIPDIVKAVNKETGAEVFYDEDPRALIDRCVAAFERRKQEGTAYRLPARDG